MAIIRPFKGFRPRNDVVKDIASHPYDVINSREARDLVKGKPLSFLHVVRSEVDLPEDTNPYDDIVYEKALLNLNKLISDGYLVEDKTNSIYLYQQQMGTHKQIGILACASVDEYNRDIIKKHEFTRADKENDRYRHVSTLNANTGPVFLTYPAVKEIDIMVEDLTKTEPDYDFQAEDGVYHTLWCVDNPNVIEKIRLHFEEMPALYVADGHHRSASAARVGQDKRMANPNHTGEEEYNFFLAVFFPHNQLKIMDYNRVIKDLYEHSVEEFITKVREKFIVEQVPQYKHEQKHTFGMYIAGKWYKLTAIPDSFDEDNPVKSLDVSILQDNLLTPILGIIDPRTDKRIDFVGGIRGLEELEKRVNNGEAVAFAVHPTSVDDLMSIADMGEVMPPKSTWFEPKLKSGMVVHFLG